MSTTTELSVAIQYTGGKEMPTVFKIGIGAVNRGAVLDAFSQYPEEKEVLFPPLSFLEVVGEITYMTTKDNKVVRVVPLEIIANLNSPLLEVPPPPPPTFLLTSLFSDFTSFCSGRQTDTVSVWGRVD
jgi:hypothetical protein